MWFIVHRVVVWPSQRLEEIKEREAKASKLTAFRSEIVSQVSEKQRLEAKKREEVRCRLKSM